LGCFRGETFPSPITGVLARVPQCCTSALAAIFLFALLLSFYTNEMAPSCHSEFWPRKLGVFFQVAAQMLVVWVALWGWIAYGDPPRGIFFLLSPSGFPLVPPHPPVYFLERCFENAPSGGSLWKLGFTPSHEKSASSPPNSFESFPPPIYLLSSLRSCPLRTVFSVSNFPFRPFPFPVIHAFSSLSRRLLVTPFDFCLRVVLYFFFFPI